MSPITVLLADDHTVVREGLRTLLDLTGDFEVVGEASDGMHAVEMTQELRPDVVVLDLAMPRLNGLEAARHILQLDAPVPKVLILSAHNDDAYLEQVAALGVSGYLIKQSSAQFLAKAIRDVYRGKTVYSPVIARRLRDRPQAAPVPAGRFSRAGRARKIAPHLTMRERQVLQLVTEGRANKVVAADLGISIKTVEKHRQKVMEKLDIHDIASLTRYAISVGIIESSVQCTII